MLCSAPQRRRTPEKESGHCLWPWRWRCGPRSRGPGREGSGSRECPGGMCLRPPGPRREGPPPTAGPPLTGQLSAAWHPGVWAAGTPARLRPHTQTGPLASSSSRRSGGPGAGRGHQGRSPRPGVAGCGPEERSREAGPWPLPTLCTLCARAPGVGLVLPPRGTLLASSRPCLHHNLCQRSFDRGDRGWAGSPAPLHGPRRQCRVCVRTRACGDGVRARPALPGPLGRGDRGVHLPSGPARDGTARTSLKTKARGPAVLRGRDGDAARAARIPCLCLGCELCFSASSSGGSGDPGPSGHPQLRAFASDPVLLPTPAFPVSL